MQPLQMSLPYDVPPRGCLDKVLGSECPMLFSFCRTVLEKGGSGRSGKGATRATPGCNLNSVTKAAPESLVQPACTKRCTWCGWGQ